MSEKDMVSAAVKGKLIVGVIVCLLVLFVPFFITITWSDCGTVATVGKVRKIPITIMQNGENVSITEEEYIKGALAGSIPLAFEAAALKSQAVMIRTMIYKNYLQTKSTVNADQLGINYISMKQLKTKTSTDQYRAYYDKLCEAVDKTQGLILLYNNKPIEARYHYSNTGKTRSFETAYGEKRPYLVSVNSDCDVESDVAMSVKDYKKEDLIQLIKEQLGVTTLSPGELLNQILITKNDSDGYVTLLKVGDLDVSGEEFREALSLNSTYFTIQENNGQIRFITKGKGDGIGLSQFGANIMAKRGTDYRSILKYYYKGIKIKKYTLK